MLATIDLVALERLGTFNSISFDREFFSPEKERVSFIPVPATRK
jgi:hypothetical protein